MANILAMVTEADRRALGLGSEEEFAQLLARFRTLAAMRQAGGEGVAAGGRAVSC